MIEHLLPNLFRIEIPLPDNPLKSINSYVIKAADRNLIIDTAFNREVCRDVMQKALMALEIDLTRTDFFSTHCHGDHWGLIPALATEQSTAYMSSTDARVVGEKKGLAIMKAQGIINGFPVDVLESAINNHPGRKHVSTRPITWRPVEDGDTIQVGDYRLTCLSTPGHSPGHLCLYEADKRILFSGDHILGDITPNIQVWFDEDNPLANYINSLNKVVHLPVNLLLPGHRSRIDSLPERVAELKTHHLNRCNEVLRILGRGQKTAYETAAEMSWDIAADNWLDFPLLQRWFATAEGAAHIRYLERKQLILREPSPEGAHYYTTVNGAEVLNNMD